MHQQRSGRRCQFLFLGLRFLQCFGLELYGLRLPIRPQLRQHYEDLRDQEEGGLSVVEASRIPGSACGVQWQRLAGVLKRARLELDDGSDARAGEI